MQNPDERGYFGGKFGGRFVPEVLVEALAELERGINQAFADPAFWDEYHALLRDFVGRPSPVMQASRFSDDPGAAPLVLKREDLNHTGAHKINNTVGQGLLAKRMGKRRIIAETGAGQHGVATATIGAKLGIPVEVFMSLRRILRATAPNQRRQKRGRRRRPPEPDNFRVERDHE
jgi:tryptophan synthase beta chain